MMGKLKARKKDTCLQDGRAASTPPGTAAVSRHRCSSQVLPMGKARNPPCYSMPLSLHPIQAFCSLIPTIFLLLVVPSSPEGLSVDGCRGAGTKALLVILWSSRE